jgi:hypothetical protein
MERRRNGYRSFLGRQHRKGNSLPYGTMADPELLSKVQVRGVRLQETSIQVLGLSGYDLKRLGDFRLFSLEQLANCLEADILNIPHFGIMKVRRMKASLSVYLNSRLNGDRPELELQSETISREVSEPAKSDIKVTDSASEINSPPELEAVSKSLDKLEKRVKSLKSRLARARKSQRINPYKVAVKFY